MSSRTLSVETHVPRRQYGGRIINGVLVVWLCIGAAGVVKGVCPATVAPTADPSGVRQNRYISFTPGNAGVVSAIRVKLVDLQNPVPANAPPFPPPNFSRFEFGATCTDPGGCVRWVGPPTDFPDEPPVGVTFKAAALQCTPHYRDWGGVGLLRVYGSETLPSSAYDVQDLALGCDEGPASADYSAPLAVNTARWGDVAPPYIPPSSGPDAIDILQLVYKWQGRVGAPEKWQMQLGPNVPDPTKRIDTMDMALVVDAFKGFAYSLRGPIVCPYPPSCPDGVVDRGEECDDGNSVNGDGCDASCRAETRTAVVSLVPVLPYGTSAERYFPGTVIQGNNVFFPLGGERVWLELRLSGWDPDLNGTPRLETWQVQIDADGFMSGDAGTLALAVQACAVNADCTAAFGPDSKCGFPWLPERCAPAFRDHQHPGDPPLSASVDLSTPDFRFGASSAGLVLDPGTSAYAATLVLDIPDEAQGRFTIGFDPSLLNTYMFDSSSPVRRPIPITLQPAVITVVGKNRFLTVSHPPTVPGGPWGPMTALRLWMIDLQHPVPANTPTSVTKNYTTFDTALNGVCVGGSHAGHHCDVDADCRLCGGSGANTNNPCASDTDCPGGFCPTSVCTGDARRPCSTDANCTGFGTCGSAVTYTCGSLALCTAAGELNGCARWVGEPHTFLEAQDSPDVGSFRAARLQCTPYYHDWANEGRFHVTGAEIIPSSFYDLETLASTCMGIEDTCADVSDPVRLFTARWSDVTPQYAPPAVITQPDSLDVTVLVAKFKSEPGSPSKAVTQLQPNLPELNADINALDLVAVVDAVKGFAYSFAGPCPCPSQATCGAFACGPTVCTWANICVGGSNNGANCTPPLLPTTCTGGGVCTLSTQLGLGPGAMCVKTCSGSGDSCINNGHCPTGETCGSPFCRDKCGRCSP